MSAVASLIWSLNESGMLNLRRNIAARALKLCGDQPRASTQP